MDDLANRIMYAVQDLHMAEGMYPDHTDIRVLYPITHQGSKLRLYVAAITEWNTLPSTISPCL